MHGIPQKASSILEQDNFLVFKHLSDLTEQTLCPKIEGAEHHAKKCLMRQCPNCGVQKLPPVPEGASLSNSAPKVKGQEFEYVEVGVTKEGKKKKKLQLVDKVILLGEMFACLKELMSSIVSHQFTRKLATAVARTF